MYIFRMTASEWLVKEFQTEKYRRNRYNYILADFEVIDCIKMTKKFKVIKMKINKIED